jgi:hypothetical protein
LTYEIDTETIEGKEADDEYCKEDEERAMQEATQEAMQEAMQKTKLSEQGTLGIENINDFI